MRLVGSLIHFITLIVIVVIFRWNIDMLKMGRLLKSQYHDAGKTIYFLNHVQSQSSETISSINSCWDSSNKSVSEGTIALHNNKIKTSSGVETWLTILQNGAV